MDKEKGAESKKYESSCLQGCFLIVLFVFIVAGTFLMPCFLSAWYWYPLGGIVGIAVFWIVFKLFGLLINTIYSNGRPPCRRCGKHGRIVTETDGQGKAICQVEGKWTMICLQCSERYLPVDSHFYLLDPQNRKIPWVRWKPFLGWVKDELPILKPKTYRGISVVNSQDIGDIIIDFIKEQHYKFCLYDNGGDGTGLDSDSPWAEKFYLSAPLIPKEFFPPEYWTLYHKLNKSVLPRWKNKTYRLAECNEEFYVFLKMGLGMSMYVTAFFKDFIPYAEIFRHMSHGTFDYTLADSCELEIEISGYDQWYLNIFSHNKTLLADLEAKFSEKQFQTCKCLGDSSGQNVEYEFKDGFLEKISKGSPPVPNPKFDWNLYNGKEQ